MSIEGNGVAEEGTPRGAPTERRRANACLDVVEMCRIDGLVHEAPAKGGEPLTAIEVGQMLPGVTRVGDRLSRLVRHGAVRRVRRGTYERYDPLHNTAGNTGNEGRAQPSFPHIPCFVSAQVAGPPGCRPTEAPWTL